jgi:hypothetical protein
MDTATTLPTPKSDPMVVLVSLWRNDEFRALSARAAHLLAKTYPNVRWLWLVGDSSDGTEGVLRRQTENNPKVTVVKADTGIEGSDPWTRLRRLGATVDRALETINDEDDLVLIHESDLRSAPNVIERFLATGLCPIAGWPTLDLGARRVFYDTWAYRAAGTKFTNYPPYHQVYRPNEPFEVEGFGSVYMFHAEDVRAGLRSGSRACLTLCDQLRTRFGRTLWVDPRIEIVQPTELWTPSVPSD